MKEKSGQSTYFVQHVYSAHNMCTTCVYSAHNMCTPHTTCVLRTQHVYCAHNMCTAHTTCVLRTQHVYCAHNMCTAHTTCVLRTQHVNCAENMWTAYITCGLRTQHVCPAHTTCVLRTQHVCTAHTTCVLRTQHVYYAHNNMCTAHTACVLRTAYTEQLLVCTAHQTSSMSRTSAEIAVQRKSCECANGQWSIRTNLLCPHDTYVCMCLKVTTVDISACTTTYVHIYVHILWFLCNV